MRNLICCAVFLIAGALTVAAADITGKWRGTLTPENRDPGSALLVLKQAGDVVTGFGGQDEDDRNEISNGKVEGNTITFEIQRGDRSMKLS